VVTLLPTLSQFRAQEPGVALPEQLAVAPGGARIAREVEQQEKAPCCLQHVTIRDGGGPCNDARLECLEQERQCHFASLRVPLLTGSSGILHEEGEHAEYGGDEREPSSASDSACNGMATLMLPTSFSTNFMRRWEPRSAMRPASEADNFCEATKLIHCRDAVVVGQAAQDEHHTTARALGGELLHDGKVHLESGFQDNEVSSLFAKDPLHEVSGDSSLILHKLLPPCPC